MRLVAALDNSKAIKPVLCAHETVCSGAADGYSRVARKPACTLLHLGVGVSNALTNLHNAMRAHSPVVNIVGEMSTWHRGVEAPLNTPLQTLAGTVSGTRPSSLFTAHFPLFNEADLCNNVPGHTEVVEEAAQVREKAVSALAATRGTQQEAAGDARSESRISTLIVPHDVQFNSAPNSAPRVMDEGVDEHEILESAERFLGECAESLKSAARVGFLLGGEAMIADGTLQAVNRAAKACNAEMLCPSNFARVDRGKGRPKLRRLPYFPRDQRAELGKFDSLVVMDATLPVAPFGYPGGQSHVVTLPDECIWYMDCGPIKDLACRLAELLGGTECLDEEDEETTEEQMAEEGGNETLTPRAVCEVVSSLQPRGAIIVDESLTSGTHYWECSNRSEPFVHLGLSGGAIGDGPPLATGAALAAPERRAINLQAEGSSLYSMCSLWTQASEGLDVVTVLCNNASYSILRLEAMVQAVPGSSSVGGTVTKLTDLAGIDFVELAEGYGATASRATTRSELRAQLGYALKERSSQPHLIDCRLSL